MMVGLSRWRHHPSSAQNASWSIFPTPQHMDHLPQEIIDAVVEQLHNDFQSLKTCSLVSHGLLSSTRRHLFHTIVVDWRIEVRPTIVPPKTPYEQDIPSTPS